jgi:hypothetical protein
MPAIKISGLKSTKKGRSGMTHTDGGSVMAHDHASANPSAMAKAGMDTLAKLQNEVSGTFEEATQYWITRAKSEAELTSDLVAKLAAAPSVPAATAMYHEWMGQRMQRLAEDSQKFVTDCQKLGSSWTRLVANGGLTASS